MLSNDQILSNYRAAAGLPVSVGTQIPQDATAVIVPLAPGEALPQALALDTTPEQLQAAGFAGKAGEVLVLPGIPAIVLVGTGAPTADSSRFTSESDAWAAAIRDAVGLGSRRAAPLDRVAVLLPDAAAPGVVSAVVEGAVLGRYHFDALRENPKAHPLASLTLVRADSAASLADAESGRAAAAASWLTRDLANTPHNHMTATSFADIAAELGAQAGLEVTVWGADEVRAEGLGGVLGINAGSAQPPRVVTLTYRPTGEPTGRLALVGKGIMYDSGGIGLKPNDDSHAKMKNDMAGAAAILGAMLALPAIGGSAEVTGYLMCTDNMPSATATALGDVVTMRGGRTVEIVDTDAEGRMVLADGITLAGEREPDAIVDIATLTGHVMRALGTEIAGTMGSAQGVVDGLRAAGSASGEPLWQLPLAPVYRPQLDSPTADQRNVAPVGIPDGLIAALFLHSYTGDIPWGHVDIAGTAWNNATSGWRCEGSSGFGARLLLTYARAFTR